MKLSFYRLSVLTAILFLIIAITWMFAPMQFLSPWGVDYSTAAGLIGRRVAALYAGIAVMFFMARNAETSIARTALISGMITACMVLAFLGVYEFSTQNANPGILISVVIELAIAIAFMCVKCTRQTNYS